MAGEIKVKYGDVYGKTAALRSQLKAELDNMENTHRHNLSMLDNVDGATNAALKRTMEANRQKTIIASKTLDKLLSFMENSSKQIEASEQKVKGIFATFTNTVIRR